MVGVDSMTITPTGLDLHREDQGEALVLVVDQEEQGGHMDHLGEDMGERVGIVETSNERALVGTRTEKRNDLDISMRLLIFEASWIVLKVTVLWPVIMDGVKACKCRG